MKHKIKHRLKAAFMAAFSLLALTLTSLTASAWTGIGAGDVNGARFTYKITPYGYFTGSDQFAWRVNMYVSANEDGKIKESDTVGSTSLPLVGSLFCTGDKWVTSTVGDTYIQTNYTDTSRNTFYSKGTFIDNSSEDIGSVKYTLPTMQKFDQYQGTYDSYTSKGNKHTVAIADSGKIPLFKGQYNTELNFTTISNYLTGDEAGKYTTDILKQLLDESKGGQEFVKRIKESLNPKIGKELVNKCGGTITMSDIYRYILPYNPEDHTKSEPMVEWAMVITPLYRFDCKVPFYCYDINGDDQQFGSPSANVNAALDAYWFAQYNETSKALSKAGYFPGNYTKQDGSIGSIANSSIGMLAFWLDNSAGKAANAAYCLEKTDPYLGVFTNINNNTTIDRWASLLKTTPYGPSEYAKRGGIAVFTTKIETPEAPVYYHTYTYRIDENEKDKLPDGYTTGTYSTDDPQLLKFLDDLTEESVTVTKVEAPKDNIIYPKQIAKDKEMPGIVVAAMAPLPSITQPGYVDEYPTYVNIKDYYAQLLPDFAGQTKHTQALVDDAKLLRDNGTTDNTADDPKEFHVKIVHIEVIPEVPVVTGQSLNDRIKSYDVTQLIEDTKKTIENAKARYGSNKHIDLLSTYANNNFGEYNKKNFESLKHTGVGTANNFNNLAVITSKNQKNPDIKSYAYDTTYTHTSPNCPWSCDGDWDSCDDVYDYTTTPPTFKYHDSDETECGAECSSTLHKCTYLEDYIVTVYGANPTQKYRWEKKGNSTAVSQHANWKAPVQTVNSSTVGFAIPENYYANADVVKLFGSQKIYKDKEYYLNLNKAATNLHSIQAKEVAALDVLLETDNTFFIRYVNDDDKQIGTKDHTQYDQFTNNDKKEDFSSVKGKSAWNYLSGSNADITGVKFISHRDYISGDKVQTSLVVSGYMAKYGYNAQTNEYLDFMKRAGFTFEGINALNSSASYDNSLVLNGTLSTAPKVVNVANSLVVDNLKAFQNTAGAGYNTHYTAPTDDKLKVKFGLGGLDADGGDIYTHIEKAGNLKDLDLTTSGSNATRGDVSRSIWYYPEHKDSGDSAPCYGYHTGYYHAASSNSSCDECGAGGTDCEEHDVEDTLGNKHSNWVTNSKGAKGYQYIEQPGGYYFVNTMYGNHTAKAINGTQTEAVEKIETSRLSFLIPVAVEGTIAGVWDKNGENGLNYNSDKLEVNDGYLRYKNNTTDKEEQTWRQTAFEMVQSHYNDLGSSDTNRNAKNEDVLAEYRYSIPTKTFKFNPSYYMQFDTGFETKDQNHAVWMLSNQPREINFKDILDIRLTQPISKVDSNSAKNGYATMINSEWSTDKTDNDILKGTGLPTIKAGNAYTTSTDVTGGTITMYVVLQDPEFAAPNRKTEIENYNNSVMKSYQQTVNDILADLKDNGFQMYTNAVNGSSKDSGMQVHTGTFELNDKEPMKFNNNEVTVKHDKVDVNPGTKADFDKWTYYALRGNKFKAQLNADTYQNAAVSNTDISDTVNNRKISIDSTDYSIKNMDDAKGHVSTTLTELNERLTGIMSAPQYSQNGNKAQGTTKIPSTYKPYADWDSSSETFAFDWYGEDYEGFVVAVYTIDFSRESKNAFKANGEAVLTKTTTDPATIYRHESDWQSKTNEDAHELKTPSYKISGVDHIYASTKTTINNLELESNGEILLLTKDGQKTLREWAKKYSKTYSEEIYGMGVELRIPVHMSNANSCATGSKSIKSTDEPNKKVSFFYQPTYFNIRGSVYDTAR